MLAIRLEHAYKAISSTLSIYFALAVQLGHGKRRGLLS
jgi:hypothetical protein